MVFIRGVPDELRRRILVICAQQLTANGIAYISYNTLPGWHTRALMRDAMLVRRRGLTARAAQSCAQTVYAVGIVAITR